MDISTIQYISNLLENTQKIDLSQIKTFLVEELQKYIPFTSAVWASRQNELTLENLEQTYTYGYHPQQLADYRNYGDDDVFREYLVAHPGEAAIIGEVCDIKRLRHLSLFNEFVPRYQIEDCLGIYTNKIDYRFNHLLSLHSNVPGQHFTTCHRQILTAVFPIFCQIIRLNLSQYQEKHWIFDVSGKVDNMSLKSLARYIGTKESQIKVGDFFVVPKHQFHPALIKLSHSEQVVARLIAQGLSNKEIARELDKSPSTVAKQITSIFYKLEVKSRTELTNKLRKL